MSLLGVPNVLAPLVTRVCFIACIWCVLYYQHLWSFCLALSSILFYPDISLKLLLCCKALISYPYEGQVLLTSSKHFSHLPFPLPVLPFKTCDKRSCYVCRSRSSNCYFSLSRHTRILLDNSISCGVSATIWVCLVNNAQRPWFVILLIALEDRLPVYNWIRKHNLVVFHHLYDVHLSTNLTIEIYLRESSHPIYMYHLSIPDKWIHRPGTLKPARLNVSHCWFSTLTFRVSRYLEFSVFGIFLV